MEIVLAFVIGIGIGLFVGVRLVSREPEKVKHGETIQLPVGKGPPRPPPNIVALTRRGPVQLKGK